MQPFGQCFLQGCPEARTWLSPGLPAPSSQVVCVSIFNIYRSQHRGDLPHSPSSGSAFPHLMMFDAIFEYYYHLSHLQRGEVRHGVDHHSQLHTCHQSVNTQALSPHMVGDRCQMQPSSPGDHSHGGPSRSHLLALSSPAGCAVRRSWP